MHVPVRVSMATLSEIQRCVEIKVVPDAAVDGAPEMSVFGTSPSQRGE